jgi:hypothetical protein
MAAKVDLSRFRSLVRALSKARGKPLAEMLNKGLTTAIIGSDKYKGIVQLAPKATAERIKTDLRNHDLNIRMAVAELKKQGYFAAKHSRAEIQAKIAEVAKARLAKRLKSRAYIAAGWIKALQDLGILKKGKRETRFWEGGTAAEGYGEAATSDHLVAKAFSMSRGTEIVLAELMQVAINNACQDMQDYFNNKGKKIWDSLAGGR